METTNNQKNNVQKGVIAVVVFWAIAVFFLGYSRVFSKLPAPSIGVAVAAIIAALTLVYLYSKSFKALADAIPLRSIAWLHTFRILGGLAFIAKTGALPQLFINHVGYGDIISGLLALGVLFFGQTKRNYLLFNVIGTLDLLNALRLGFTFALMGNDQIKGLGELPLIIIILFIVPILVITHIISFNRLLKAKDLTINQVIQ